MPIYAYKVRDKYGMVIRGKMEGTDSDAVEGFLRASEQTPLEISLLSSWEHFYVKLSQQIKGVKHNEVLLFIRQLSTMIRAGLPLLTCLDNIIKQMENPRFKEVLQRVYQDIEQGKSFSDALESHPKYFSNFFVSMVSVGEIGGQLDQILDRLVVLGRKETEIKSKLKGAMVYPCVLIFLALGIVGYLMVAVLPKFIVVYDSMGVDLPTSTNVLLAISGFCKNYWWISILITIGVFHYVRQYRQTEAGRFNIDQIILKIPIIGTLLLKYSLARFTRTLGSLLKSGLALLQALNVTESTVDNAVLKLILKQLRASILEGKSLSGELRYSQLFPPMVVQMVNAGEQTGRLDEMLLEIADFYDTEVEYEIRNLTTIVEPVLLILMGMIVLFIGLSVLKPIFSLVKVVR